MFVLFPGFGNCSLHRMLWFIAAGGKDFRKKSNRAVDNLTNIGDSEQNKDLDGALYSGSNELVYEV